MSDQKNEGPGSLFEACMDAYVNAFMKPCFELWRRFALAFTGSVGGMPDAGWFRGPWPARDEGLAALAQLVDRCLRSPAFLATMRFSLETMSRTTRSASTNTALRRKSVP